MNARMHNLADRDILEKIAQTEASLDDIKKRLTAIERRPAPSPLCFLRPVPASDQPPQFASPIREIEKLQ